MVLYFLLLLKSISTIRIVLLFLPDRVLDPEAPRYTLLVHIQNRRHFVSAVVDLLQWAVWKVNLFPKIYLWDLRKVVFLLRVTVTFAEMEQELDCYRCWQTLAYQAKGSFDIPIWKNKEELNNHSNAYFHYSTNTKGIRYCKWN